MNGISLSKYFNWERSTKVFAKCCYTTEGPHQPVNKKGTTVTILRTGCPSKIGERTIRKPIKEAVQGPLATLGDAVNIISHILQIWTIG